MNNYGLIYRMVTFLCAPFIRRVSVTEPHIEAIKKTMEAGQVVFVAQTASVIDFLILTKILERNGLKNIGFTHGIPCFFTMPFKESLSRCFALLFRSIEDKAEKDKKEIADAAAKGENGLIFLKNRWKLFSRKTFYYQGFFNEIIEAKSDDRELHIIPTSVFLTRRRKSSTRSGWEIFFGTYDIPSRPRKLYQLLTHVNRGLTVFSNPIHISEQLKEAHSQDPRKVDKRIRWTLLIHLNNEDRAYRGPTKRHKKHKVLLILKDPILKRELEQIAEKQKRSLESVMKEAEKNLSQMTSDTSDRVMFFLKTIFDFVWNRTLDGVYYHPEELNMIRELSTKGPLILLPSHRSHVDYLVLSHLFEGNGLNPPRFAAGDNLAKWPMGPVFRRAGAFFIKRSFRGETIFPVVFEAYIRQALRDRQPITFFMEGGRSRTGKLLNPKVGMLGMILNSWSSGVVKRIPLIPITIDYGKVFEGQAYLSEKSGSEKKKEGLKSLLSTPKYLKRKHGVVRIRISKPLYFESELEASGLTKDKLTFRNKIPFLNMLSHKVMSQINSRVSLTAGNIAAGILLANPKRGMTYEDLKGIFILTVRFLKSKNVELVFHERKNVDALDHALDTFQSWETLLQVQMGKNRILSVPASKRNEMEYYKNNGIHFILDLALFSSAFSILAESQRTLDQIENLSREIYDILATEFILPENYFDSLDFNEIAHVFVKNGGVTLENGLCGKGLSDIGRKTLTICSNILLNFIESYFCAFDVLLQDDFEDEASLKDLKKDILTRSELLFNVGTISTTEAKNQVSFSNALNMLRARKIIKLKNANNMKSKLVSLNPNKLSELKGIHEKLYRWMDLLQ
ncbi:MAG: hypothetical protein CSA81_08530 [Acidobacteria bacterium]|nr:MAG: hypothetical protein CSA81_08530 [Acidobacteriota bacterium]